MSDYTQHDKDGFGYHLYMPASGKAPEALVVVFHGHASSPQRWETRCGQLQQALPNSAVIVIRGPLRAKSKDNDQRPVYGWLDFTTPVRQGKHWLRHAFNKLAIVDQLNLFLSRRLQEMSLTPDRLALVGSSMGGIVALQASFHSKEPYAAVIGYSTAVLPFSKPKTKPGFIMLSAGSEDKLFNAKPWTDAPLPERSLREHLRDACGVSMQMADSVHRLEASKILYYASIHRGVGHEITDEMWDEGARCIAHVIPQPFAHGVIEKRLAAASPSSAHPAP